MSWFMLESGLDVARYSSPLTFGDATRVVCIQKYRSFMDSWAIRCPKRKRRQQALRQDKHKTYAILVLGRVGVRISRTLRSRSLSELLSIAMAFNWSSPDLTGLTGLLRRCGLSRQSVGWLGCSFLFTFRRGVSICTSNSSSRYRKHVLDLYC